MILDEQRNREVWDWIYGVLYFAPYGGVDFVPFHIPFVHSIYDVSQMKPEHTEKMDDLIISALLNYTEPGERLYALDWNHSSFLFDPRVDGEMEDIYVEDSRYIGGDIMHIFHPFTRMEIITSSSMKSCVSVICLIRGGERYGYSERCRLKSLKKFTAGLAG